MMKIVVFGHYDSRGGTTGYAIPDAFTEADVQAAIRKYNSMFGWEEDVARYKADPSGWQWNPTQPGSSPAEQDFLFIAELHYEGEMPEGDLEESGVVLIDEASGVERECYSADALKDPLMQLEYLPLGKSRYESESDYEEARKDEMGLVAVDAPEWEVWIGTQGKFLKGEKVGTRNWNDDAFGFIVE